VIKIIRIRLYIVCEITSVGHHAQLDFSVFYNCLNFCQFQSTQLLQLVLFYNVDTPHCLIVSSTFYKLRCLQVLAAALFATGKLLLSSFSSLAYNTLAFVARITSRCPPLTGNGYLRFHLRSCRQNSITGSASNCCRHFFILRTLLCCGL